MKKKIGKNIIIPVVAVVVVGIIASLLITFDIGNIGNGTSSEGPTSDLENVEETVVSGSGEDIVSEELTEESAETQEIFEENPEQETIEESPIVTKAPSEMVLDISDIKTGNWSIAERTERTKNDVSLKAVADGWQEGYYIRIFEGPSASEKVADELTVVENAMSIYPLENISAVLTRLKLNESELSGNNLRIGGLRYRYTVEELSNPNIGDDSIAYRWTLTDAYSRTSRQYEISFVKKNVFQLLQMRGTVTDYELLKDLAKTVESKIE